jgi:hypothetical protein
MQILRQRVLHWVSLIHQFGNLWLDANLFAGTQSVATINQKPMPHDDSFTLAVGLYVRFQ